MSTNEDTVDSDLKGNASVTDLKRDASATEGKAINGAPVISGDPTDSPYFLDEEGNSKKDKKLPPWLDHLNLKDLRALFKASLCVWTYTLLIFINPTLRVEAQQRSSDAHQMANNTEQASGQAAYTQILVFQGFMLETRISIVYFCMISVFVYFMARLRAKIPKLALMAMFSWIITDIFLVIAPLIPSFNGTIAQLLIKPAATGAGFGLAFNIFLFPESTSLKTLDDMQTLFKPMKGFFDACLISFSNPTTKLDLLKLQEAKSHVVTAYKQVEASLGFLPLDLSISRWNADDVTSLRELMTKVVTMYTGLLSLQIARMEAGRRHMTMDDMEAALQDGDETRKNAVGAHQMAMALDVRHKMQHPEQEELLWKSMAALMDSSDEILHSCNDTVDAVVEAIDTVNSRRWIRAPSAEQCEQMAAKHNDVLQRLNTHIDGFAGMSTEHLLAPHAHLFNENGYLNQPDNKGTMAPMHGLLLGLLFEERILGVARALSYLLTRVVELERGRTKKHLWFPTGFRHFAAWVFGDTPTPSVGTLGDTGPAELEKVETVKEQEKEVKKSGKSKPAQKKDEEQTEAAVQLETIRYHPGKRRGAFNTFVLAVVQWLTNDDALFATRVVLVTIAAAVPAVCTSTAGFYYREKGLWALIMAQMGMGTYTADFVYGMVLRTLGTVLGGVIGMVCWYIGAGNGPGEPYGMAAIVAVFIVILMWGRLFTGMALLQFWMLYAATMFLTLGYSWVDTPIPSYGNPGVGYNVFWRRVVLVLVGFSISAIIMLFTRPPSASRHYRKVMARTVRNMKDLYALFVASYRDPHEGLIDTVEKETLTIAESHLALIGPIKMTKLEFSITNFDADTLTKVNSLCMTNNQALVQLFIFSAKLRTELRDRFVRLSGALDENIVGDIMAVLTLIEQSLKTGDPLPALLPVPLTARCLGLQRRVQKLRSGEEFVTKEMIMNEEYRKYCVVISSFVQIINATDELVLVVKGACGETHVVDAESWPLMARGDRDSDD